MLSTLFRFGTYYVLFQAFRRQFITLVISGLIVLAIFGLYSDLYMAIKAMDKSYLIWLIVGKWSLLLLIVVVNVLLFKRFSKSAKNEYAKNEQYINRQEESKRSKNELNVGAKKSVRSRSDLILDKYSQKASKKD